MHIAIRLMPAPYFDIAAISHIDADVFIDTPLYFAASHALTPRFVITPLLPPIADEIEPATPMPPAFADRWPRPPY